MNEPIKNAAKILKALTNETRIRIIDNIRSKGRMSVGDITVSLEMDQSAVSQHLKLLLDAGVMKYKRVGKVHYYSLCDERINAITDLCLNISQVKEKELKPY
jgi:DNA-binding transcriptional ArsR family regulator